MRHCLQRNTDLAVVVVGAALPLLLLAAQSSVPFEHFVVDPFAFGNLPPFIGLFSNLGVGCWLAGGGIAFFSALVLLRSGVRTEAVLFLRAAGLFSLWLGIDDFFMFHDWVFPRFSPLTEHKAIALNAVAGIALVTQFRKILWNSRREAVLLTAGLFALSVSVDFVHDGWALEMEALLGETFTHLLEDGPKFVGICLWAYFLISESACQMLQYLNARPVQLSEATRG